MAHKWRGRYSKSPGQNKDFPFLRVHPLGFPRFWCEHLVFVYTASQVLRSQPFLCLQGPREHKRSWVSMWHSKLSCCMALYPLLECLDWVLHLCRIRLPPHALSGRQQAIAQVPGSLAPIWTRPSLSFPLPASSWLTHDHIYICLNTETLS